LSGLDLSTVSAVTLHVMRPDGTSSDWATSLSAQSPTSVTATHVFAAADVPVPGKLTIEPRMTVPGGTWPVERFNLIVS
jgi:hypothetical protein